MAEHRLSLIHIYADTEFVVVEMGMRGLGQLEELCAFVKPDISLITNVGECHMELLGSKENIDVYKRQEYSKEGVPVPGSEKVTAEVVNGQDIVLSIDVDMQQKLEESLALRVEEVQGKGGSAILMDSATGEIYACSSSPTFDITDLSEVKEGATNLSGISSAYEPGSIMKLSLIHI